MAKKAMYDVTVAKVQKTVLAETIKQCNRVVTAHNNWIYGESKNEVDNTETVWIGDGHFLAAIPRQYCFISLKETFNELGRFTPVDVKAIIKDGTKASLLEDPKIMKATRIGEMRTLKDGRVVEVFTLEDHMKVHVDTRLLSYFGDNLNFCEFYGGTPKSPLWIVNTGLVVNGIVGLVMPVLVNE